VRTGRTVRLALPDDLHVGRHRVRITVRGLRGDRPARSRAITLTVTPKPKPRPKRKPGPAPERTVPAPAPRDTAPPPPVPPSLGGRDLVAGVFPVQGPYSFGGADSRFGAARRTHTLEGQDIPAASGTPVVAPLAGSVLFNDYQRSGAGRYVVLAADNGWHMFFAHCLAGSATLKPGTRVAAGGQLCAVGSTGGSTGPHLHLELWPDGWRHLKGTRPIDPLAQLRRWAGG
jgi:murein DD-endopeptidase MepM/ murein hydrolase activator NlpD